jgi:hypothetical protein
MAMEQMGGYSKPWVGVGNPCTPNDHDLFAAAITVTIGNGKKAKFWESSWLNGMHPKDIAPKIFELAKRRNCTVKRALENEWWVSNINLQNGLTVEHIVQFSYLWEELQHVQLHDDTTDSIHWKFGKDDGYTASSVYKMQFLGHTNSAMTSMVWKPWAPPKC